MKSAFFKSFLIWMVAVGVLRSDRVQLQNGNELEGRVLREDDREVVLRMGGGTVTLARSSVRKISMESEEINARRDDAWNRQHVLHPTVVPPGWMDVATGLQGLTDRRNGAVRAWRELKSMEEESRRLKAEFEQAQQALAAISGSIADTRPLSSDAEAVLAYNEKVMRQNRMFSANLERQITIDSLAAQMEKAGATVSDYQQRLGAFRALYDQRRADLPKNETPKAVKTFVEGLSERLAVFEKDCVAFTIPTVGNSGGRKVAVTINGRPAGSFVVDTGASTVMLTSDLAARLGIAVDPGRVAQFRVADGRDMECPVVWLDSVQVGEARAERVLAGVVPVGGQGSSRVDGLLGMTFLKNFMVELDGRTGGLTLRKFEPR